MSYKSPDACIDRILELLDDELHNTGLAGNAAKYLAVYDRSMDMQEEDFALPDRQAGRSGLVKELVSRGICG